MVKVSAITLKGDGSVDLERSMLAIGASGKSGRGSGFGFARLSNANFGDSRPTGGIFRRKWTGYNQYGYSPKRKRKLIHQRMRYYRTPNPRTVEQQANRSKFADAVAAWAVLNPVEKSWYNERGKRKNKIGRNLFISWYLKNN